MCGKKKKKVMVQEDSEEELEDKEKLIRLNLLGTSEKGVDEDPEMRLKTIIVTTDDPKSSIAEKHQAQLLNLFPTAVKITNDEETGAVYLEFRSKEETALAFAQTELRKISENHVLWNPGADFDANSSNVWESLTKRRQIKCDPLSCAPGMEAVAQNSESSKNLAVKEVKSNSSRIELPDKKESARGITAVIQSVYDSFEITLSNLPPNVTEDMILKLELPAWTRIEILRKKSQSIAVLGYKLPIQAREAAERAKTGKVSGRLVQVRGPVAVKLIDA